MIPVDFADALPGEGRKIYTVAFRHKVPVRPFCRAIPAPTRSSADHHDMAGDAFDAADDLIAAEAAPGKSLVITADRARWRIGR